MNTLDKKLSAGGQKSETDALLLEQKEIALQQVDAQLKAAKEKTELLQGEVER